MVGLILLGVLTLEIILHFVIKRAEHKKIEKNKKGVNDHGIS